MRTRNNDWFTSEDSTLHGIEVSEDGKQWFHLSKNNAPMLFNTEDERLKVREDIRYAEFKDFLETKTLRNGEGQQLHIANIGGIE